MTTQAIRRAACSPIAVMLIAAAAAAFTLSVPAQAGDKPAAQPHHLGDHPAVVVQRLQRQAGYDYASKFYPHPAHLYLLPASPDELERMHAAARAAQADSVPDPLPETHGPVAQR
jgi:hypothetical protein